LPDLVRHGLGDLRVRVAERTAPQARQAVEKPLALDGGVVRALGAREDPRARIPLEVAVAGERHPVRAGAHARGPGDRLGFGLHDPAPLHCRGDSLHWAGVAGGGGRRKWKTTTIGANPMYTNLVIVFNFILSQWSLSPQAFKDAVLYAAL